jgi:TolA-binding protein
MPSTLTRQQGDPHDAIAIEPRVGVAPAAPSPDPVHEVLSLLSRRRAQVAPGVSAVAPTPAVDTTFRAAAVDDSNIPGDRPAMGRWKKASIAFLFALCSALAASTWNHHGDAARAMIASWMPPSAFTSSAPTETPPPAPDQAAAADQAQLLPSMARDLAAMGQQIEQLKASIEQLRDSQAQMSRDIAKNSEIKTSEAKAPEIKASEPNVRPRVATLPPRPVTAPPRRPRPAFPQAAATSTLPPPPYPPLPPPAQSQPAPPPQTAAEPDGEPVVRPPMPLH